MTKPRISDDRALKVADAYPGRPVASRRVLQLKLTGIQGKTGKKIPGVRETLSRCPDEPDPKDRDAQTNGLSRCRNHE